jgi:hypothetical protein
MTCELPASGAASTHQIIPAADGASPGGSMRTFDAWMCMMRQTVPSCFNTNVLRENMTGCVGSWLGSVPM